MVFTDPASLEVYTPLDAFSFPAEGTGALDLNAKILLRAALPEEPAFSPAPDKNAHASCFLYSSWVFRVRVQGKKEVKGWGSGHLTGLGTCVFGVWNVRGAVRGPVSDLRRKFDWHASNLDSGQKPSVNAKGGLPIAKPNPSYL